MTFYFYDLETSGINPRAQRIMQFAGQRTDEQFMPIGDPQNWMIRLTEEILPDPEAVLLTGITPQKSIEEGYSEAEFLAMFESEVCQPDTVIVGFNNIRFDDEFMRSTLWRNFYDPFAWQYKQGRSRWDLLDVVRMVRALRPKGIEWPFDNKGVSTNRLELLTKVNGLDHENAHDALNDVFATIALAKLLKEKQPQIFEYLLKMRSKIAVKELVNLESRKPFVYTSGRYESDNLKTTVATPLSQGTNDNLLVYDLRCDPSPFVTLSQKEIADMIFASWEERKQDGFINLPVKELQYNRSPAVAPCGVLDQDNAWKNINLDKKVVEKNLAILQQHPDFPVNVSAAFKNKRQFKRIDDPDFQIYDGFVNENDKAKMAIVRSTKDAELTELDLHFQDKRLDKLFPRYIARNYPNILKPSQRELWDEYKTDRLLNGTYGQLSLPEFIKKLSQMSSSNDNEKSEYLLEELRLYAESLLPAPSD